MRAKRAQRGAAPAPRPGVEWGGGAHRFAIFVAGARRVELRVAEEGGFGRWTRTLPLTPPEASEGFWTGELAGLPERFTYAFSVDGGPELLDPYARELAGGDRWADRSWEEA